MGRSLLHLRLAAFSCLAMGCGAAAVLAAASCGTDNSPSQAASASSSATSSSTGGSTGSGGAGGTAGADAGTIYIPVDQCKSVGAANEVPQSDPRFQGMCLFLYDAWGTEVLNELPPASFMLDLMKNEPDVFGNQFEKFGFIHDPNDDFPIGFKRGLHDPTKVHETCAQCHVSKLPDGKVWLGAPNESINIGQFIIEVNKRWVAAGNPPLADDLTLQKDAALGPGRFDAESGSYPIAVPADVPNYYDLGKRSFLNYLGTSHNVRTEVFFAIFTFGAGAPNAQTAIVPFPKEDRVDEFLSFFGTIEAPPPPAQDASLVAQGKSVFSSAKCDSCHHPDDVSKDFIVTYDTSKTDPMERLPGADPMYPNGSIHTDIYHRALIDGSILPDGGVEGDGGSDNGFSDLLKFIGANHLQVGSSDGYRTIYLRGLWASAPYLHNGSVPTLDDLLKPAAQRPTTFMQAGVLRDTTVPANGNYGHEFGTDLSDSDKKALVAYLLSL